MNVHAESYYCFSFFIEFNSLPSCTVGQHYCS
jgi:hypothetical protein